MAMDPKIEELSDSDDSVPDLQQGQNIQVIDTVNRNEKKARKACAKLGFKKFEGVKRVTMRKNKNIIFAINKPEVWKLPGTDQYMVFGECKFEQVPGTGGGMPLGAPPQMPSNNMKHSVEQLAKLKTQLQNGTADPAQLQELFGNMKLDDKLLAGMGLTGKENVEENTQEAGTIEEGEDDAPDDENYPLPEGVTEADMRIVQDQSQGASRKECAKALAKHKGDLVEALMSLNAA